MNALKNINALLSKINPTDGARAGWCAQQALYNLHPAVLNALEAYEPLDWQAIFWEYPYVAVSDPTRLAFSRNAQHLATDRQTLTTVPRYLKRHFPMLGDHVIRDLALYTNTPEFRFFDDLQSIVAIVELTPGYSCMKGFVEAEAKQFWQSREDFDAEDSPICVYSPKLDWRMAAKLVNGYPVSRALVHKGSFVRSYLESGADNNRPDPELESWLETQDVRKKSAWPYGTPLAKVSGVNGDWFPYLDGNRQDVSEERDYYTVVDRGEYRCKHTDGTAEDQQRCTCDRCGDRCDEDSVQYVETEDSTICDDCIDNHFVWVNGNRGDGYYIRSSEALEVNGDYYNAEDLPDDIICLADGDYAHIDDAVYCEYAGEYYLNEDAVYLEDRKEHYPKDDCWEDYDGVWHHEDDESVEIEGDTYLAEDCAYDYLTETYYPPNTEMIDLPSGKQVHPSNPHKHQGELAIF